MKRRRTKLFRAIVVVGTSLTGCSLSAIPQPVPDDMTSFPDLATPDLSTVTDLAGIDFAGADLAPPPDMAHGLPPVDMASGGKDDAFSGW